MLGFLGFGSNSRLDLLDDFGCIIVFLFGFDIVVDSFSVGNNILSLDVLFTRTTAALFINRSGSFSGLCGLSVGLFG
jgi:hypothetical protein